MATTILPGGGAVNVQKPGGRAYPIRSGGTTIVKPSVAKGGGRGATGKRVGVSTRQPGRTAATGK